MSDVVSANLLAESFETATDGVILVDPQWHVLYANPTARRLIPHALTYGRSLWDAGCTPASTEGMRQRWTQVLATGISREFEEFSPLMKQWVQVRACPISAGLLLMFRPIDRHLHVTEQATETLSRFWSLFEHLPEAVTVADPNGLIVGANQAAVTMFGCQDESELKQNIAAFEGFELADAAGRVLPLDEWPMSRAIRGELFEDYRIRFRRRDSGLCIYGSCAGSPVRNASGQIILVVVTVRNITRQLEAERAVAASEAFYRALDEFLPHLLWTLDTQGCINHANRRWREFTGSTPERVAVEGIQSIIHADDIEFRNQILDKCMKSGGKGETELRFRRADGAYRWMLVRWGPVRDRDNRITQWVGTATDIHDWRSGEAALRQTMASLHASEQRFQAFMDHNPAMAWINDEHGRILYMNRTQREVIGPEASSKKNPTLWDAFPAELADRYHADNLRVIRTGVEMRDVGVSHTTENTNVPHLIFRFPLESDGRIVSAGMAIDISAQQQIQDELRAAKEAAEAANRAKDQFLAILSHELRTPLTPVLLFSSSLEKNPALPEEVRADLALIRQQVQLEARLIDDLLDLTRIQRGKFLLNLEPMHVHDVLRRVAALAGSEAVENGLHLSLNLKAERDRVQGDASRLQQLFGNVLGNAIKFTPSGGSILIQSRNEGAQVVVEISDTGIGISADALGRVFNAFEQAEKSITRRYGGLGLGLTIGKAIAEHHGGSIDAQSAGTGRGTTLRIHLPLSEVAAEPSIPTPPAPPPSRQRVLLVEDHEATREILNRLLQQIGFDVLPADSVAAAVHMGTRQPFDLLLCDIGLPDGTGLDVITKLKQSASFRAIALSGYGSDDDIARSLRAGFEQHLVKPVDYQRLREVLLTAQPAAET